MKGTQTVVIATLLLLTIGIIGIDLGGNLNIGEVGDNSFMKGFACVQVDKTDGSIWKECGQNTFTTVGTNATWERVFLVSADQFDYIAVGNGTAPTSGSTTLDSESDSCGFTRVQETPAWEAQANMTISHKWTSTCDGVVVNTTGIFNASSSGTMLAGKDFTDQTMDTDDNLTVSWFGWIVIG